MTIHISQSLYSKVYPPNLVDATEKMLSEIYDNPTVADILQTAVKSKIDPVIKQYCSEAPNYLIGVTIR